MKKIIFALSIGAFTMTACDPKMVQSTMDTVLNSQNPSNEEVGGGLKEALTLGISNGADVLSAPDGYFKSAYKILLPPEARKVTEKLQGIPGFDQVENIVLEKLNRGAEDAASKAKPIFMAAIRQMSFADAWHILTGGKGAATSYLKEKTYENLYAEFNPVIVESLDKFQARKYWGDAVNVYNKIPFTQQKVNPKLEIGRAHV